MSDTLEEKKLQALISELTSQNEAMKSQVQLLTDQNKELIHNSLEKDKRAADLIVANKDLSAFSYISSHDLQDPLLKIKNYVLCILDEEKNLSETGKQYFLRIRKTTERMQLLIGDLLTYSRTKIIENQFISCELNTIVSEVISDMEEQISERKAVINVAELGSAQVISFQFHQMFVNLIGNALKYVKEGVAPVISIKSSFGLGSEFEEIRLTPDKKYCHIEIKDNGIGFERKYQHKIFEVFQRLHTYEEYAGTGIGLAICKRVIEIHEGFISAESKIGLGSVFHLYFLEKHDSPQLKKF